LAARASRGKMAAQRRVAMAKGQMKSNKEKRKPKLDKKKDAKK
jgi:hypothetical protein